MSMSKKNPYRVVLDAVLRLPWGERLGYSLVIRRETLLCCAVGAAMFGDVPIDKRVDFFGRNKLHNKNYNCRYDSVVSNMGVDIFYAIGQQNDRFPKETPLARKNRMIKWLRERADEEDRSTR